MAQASTIDGLVPLRARDVAAWGGLSGWSFLRPARKSGAREAAEALTATGAEELRDSFLRDLSQGQKQRVTLARSLATGADLLFLDEPTAAMDAIAEQRTMELLRNLTRERKMAVVVVTHLIALARRFADQVLYLDRDDGVAVSGPPAVAFNHPTFRRQYGALG
jgi:zinc transport system ATP-binding protein